MPKKTTATVHVDIEINYSLNIYFVLFCRVTTLQESLENESNMTIKLQNHNHELLKNLENTTKVKDDLQQKLK